MSKQERDFFKFRSLIKFLNFTREPNMTLLVFRTVLKFRYSEKATQILKILHFVLELPSSKKGGSFFFIFRDLLAISELYSPHVSFGWIVNNVPNDFIGWICNKVARLVARWQHTAKMMMKLFFSQQIIVWYIHSPHVSFDWIVNNAPHFQSYTMLSYVV